MEKKELDIIRRNIRTCEGEKVRLTTKKGRKRIVVHDGVIEAAYENVFVLISEKIGETSRKVTFSYTDVLTKTVDVILFKNDQELRLTF